ncbi:MAG: hypothetical protein A3F13_01605 [Gammaproteobacteria bacterium RIFCSPHIGHO2_12_FULL_40_19]|nr:MAG: hypothetical protein A3F13_01605 [Gammaproteobacteria bacterium RIFCSPHIGHO2_12_FULL_40_19]
MFRIVCVLFILLVSLLNAGCSTFGMKRIHPAVTQPVPVDQLSDYQDYPANVKKVISKSLVLSKKHLTYMFGSANPKKGGMDCSGVFYYLLSGMDNVRVPRDSYDIYRWLLRAGTIHHVTYDHFRSKQFSALKPGDLLFWTNTFRTHRKPPITHVMLYLGKDKNNVPLMFGSSDGGIYRGREMWGVSVFQFILPRDRDRARFVAYGCIPSLTCSK